MSVETRIAELTAATGRGEHLDRALGHQIYTGDTALHLAAAAYDPEAVSALLASGATVHAVNRRGQTPLHYATDANPGSPRWNPSAQTDVVRLLLEAGADPNARDRNGTLPLHRAVRNRCSAAVAALLEGGADSAALNGRGSTALDLARRTTGRGGSGSPAAKREQAAIVALLS